MPNSSSHKKKTIHEWVKGASQRFDRYFNEMNFSKTLSIAVLSLTAMFVLVPIFVNNIATTALPASWKIKIADGDWVGFYGNYVGSFLGFAGSMLIASMVFASENHARKKDQYNASKHICVSCMVEIKDTVGAICTTVQYIIDVSSKDYLSTEDKRSLIQCYSERYETLHGNLLNQKANHFSQYELVYNINRDNRYSIGIHMASVSQELDSIISACQYLLHETKLLCYKHLSDNSPKQVDVDKLKKRVINIRKRIRLLRSKDAEFITHLQDYVQR